MNMKTFSESIRLSVMLLSVSLPFALCSCQPAEEPLGDWNIVEGVLSTKWAGEVDPSSPLPEYPRPEMVRSDWSSLNGLWEYAITGKDDPAPESFDGTILVPYPLESALSGVGGKLTGDQALWYRKSFRLPKEWKKRGAELNFGAVDYECEVYLNGNLVGSHTGGYTSFSFDMAPYLSKKKQTLLVKVLDGTDNDAQPRGKQVSNPSGIWYTAVSGIWQSVWMEPGSPLRVKDYNVVPDYEAGTLELVLDVPEMSQGDEIMVEMADAVIGYDSTKPFSSYEPIFSGNFKYGEKIMLEVSKEKAWSPSAPYIYPIKVTLRREGNSTDEVLCYAALRSITAVRDSRYDLRMALNGKPLFHYGPLDQGWWPDGLYTAPTDEALRFDIQKTKDFGYNMIRKHIKVEPARWYYWADVLGIMIWQDMPSITDSRHNSWVTRGYDGTDWDAPQSAKDTYYKEWGEIIAQLSKHPSIVVWVPFNEAWAQFDTPQVVAFTKKQDPTRLVNPASGGNFTLGLEDILDCHHYPGPAMEMQNPDLVNVLGEYGGIGLALAGHLWREDRNWGYIQFKDGDEVLRQYTEYAEELKRLISDGCSAAVYTQTTDVEIEVNGLMTYDREVVKMDQAKLREVNLSVIASMN